MASPNEPNLIGLEFENIYTVCKPETEFRLVQSNQAHVLCDARENLAGPLTKLQLTMCEEVPLKRVCVAQRSSKPLGQKEAWGLFHQQLGKLTSLYGPPKKPRGKDLLSFVEWDKAVLFLSGGQVSWVQWKDRRAREKIQSYNLFGSDFPEQVMGFKFGSSPAESEKVCERLGGAYTFLPTSAWPAPSFLCHSPQLSGLVPFDVIAIHGLFCEGGLCEVVLWLKDRFKVMAKLLTNEYGVPAIGKASSDCKPESPNLNWLWFHSFTTKDGKIRSGIDGRVLLSEGCPGSMVTYDNKEVWELTKKNKARFGF
jgi:hypothetical protein